MSTIRVWKKFNPVTKIVKNFFENLVCDNIHGLLNCMYQTSAVWGRSIALIFDLVRKKKITRAQIRWIWQGAPDLHVRSTTLEIEIPSGTWSKKDRTMRPDFHARSRKTLPSREPFVPNENGNAKYKKKFIFSLSYLKIQYSQSTNDDDSNDTAFVEN